MIMAAYLG